MQIRSAYGPRKRVTRNIKTETQTVQYFRDQVDVNNIVDRHGTVNSSRIWATTDAPQYIDCTEIPDYQAAQNAVIQANNAFHSLPAKVRQRFNNDPHQFVIFGSDPANIEFMREMGLAPPAPVAQATESKEENATDA